MRNLLLTAALLSGHCFSEAAVSEVPANGQGGPSVAGSSKKPPTLVEKVTMKDGRVVEFAGKKRLLKTTLINKDDSGAVTQVLVRLDFRNGETRTFDVLASGLAYQFAGHGAEQKLGDEISNTEDIEDAVLEVDALISRLNQGEWNKERGPGLGGTSILIKALLEFQTAQAAVEGKPAATLEEIAKKVKEFTAAQRAALKASPRVKPIIDRLEAEKVAKSANIDTDALLGSF